MPKFGEAFGDRPQQSGFTLGDLIAPGALRRSVIDPITGKPVILSEPKGEVVQRSTVLPVGRDDAGKLVPAVPGMLVNAAEAVTLPGQVARGEFSIFDPRTGHVSDEAIGKASDLAGLAMTGSLPMKAPAGALRSFGGAAFHANDPFAALEAALAKGVQEAEPEAARAGPRLLDPDAKSWDLYHGSTPGDDFARFDPAKSGNPHEQAVFFAPGADAANGYATGAGAGAEAGARVFRTTVEPGKTGVFDLTHLAETDPAFSARAREIAVEGSGATHGPLWDQHMESFLASRAQDSAIAKQVADMGLPPDPTFGTRISYGHGHIGAAIERAKAQGLDTAILRGLVEHGGDDQVVALTPGRVRSYYSPDQVLYSGGPGGTFGALLGLSNDPPSRQ